MPERKFTSNQLLTAFILFLITVVILVITAPSIGITWDEPTYIVASENSVSWLGNLITDPGYALSKQGIEDYWQFNHEHPPFDKVWSGLLWSASRPNFDDLTAHRFGNILLAGLLIALLYLMVIKEFGQLPALVSVAALLTMPRFFFHAHLAALDVPVSVMIFIVGFVFWQTKEWSGWIWTVILGIVWGLAISTKINALFIPGIVLSVWSLVFHKNRLFLLKRIFIAWVIGILVSVAIWPWLYDEPINRIIDFLSFMTLQHDEVDQYYFGHLFSPPPWHFPFVITLLVVPLSLSILYFLGSVRATFNWRTKSLTWFFILGGFVPLAIMATGKSQLFDNDRLLMPVFPYLAALVGVGFEGLHSYLNKLTVSFTGNIVRIAPSLILAIVMFLPHLLIASRLYPHLLSYYSEAVGGLKGATRLGFETTYWCETYRDALTYINSHAPHQAIVWGECRDVLFYYQLQGKLRSDLRIAGGATTKSVFAGHYANPASVQESDIAVIEFRQSGFYQPIREWLSNRQPVHRLAYQNLPLMGVYVH